MSEGAGEDTSEMDEELAGFEFSTEDIKAMSFREKETMVKTLRLSIGETCAPKQTKINLPVRNADSPIVTVQQRLLSTGVSMISIKPATEEDQDDIVVVKEIESSRNLSRRLPTQKFSQEENQSEVGTPRPLIKMSKATYSSAVRARRKIEDQELPKEEGPSPMPPKVNEQQVLMPSQYYVKHKAEIYGIDPLSCVDTALSTLEATSLSPKKKKAPVPFYCSEHALSLNMDDYIALFSRKFGCHKASLTYHEVEETAGKTSMTSDTSFPADLLDLPSPEESSAHYNLRQRSAPKRAADIFDFTTAVNSDDSESDLIPFKKSNRIEDTTFSPTTEAKDQAAKRMVHTTTGKTRVNKLSLSITKISAERKPSASKEQVDLDSDGSTDSDVPGKEVCEPKLQYSGVVAADASKWKTSKNKVSAIPKVHGKLDDAARAMDDLTSKSRQGRPKPSEVVKLGVVSGRNRRTVLSERSPTRKPRVKQANKKGADKEGLFNEEKPEEQNIQCPVCKSLFPEVEIEAHVNACCDQSVTQSFDDGECPMCFKTFPNEEIQDHSVACQGKGDAQAMEESD